MGVTPGTSMKIKHYHTKIDNLSLKEWFRGGYYVKPDGKLNPPSGSFGSLYSRIRFNIRVRLNAWKKH